MKYLIAIAVAILLAGCTTQFAGMKRGAGQAEFSNDFLECQALAQRLNGPPKFGSNDRTIFICMQGKGWNMSSPKYD
jgi:hypothetical protein